jgi:hypothetical protein
MRTMATAAAGRCGRRWQQGGGRGNERSVPVRGLNRGRRPWVFIYLQAFSPGLTHEPGLKTL